MDLKELFQEQHKLMERVSDTYKKGVYNKIDTSMDPILPPDSHCHSQFHEDLKIKETTNLIVALTDELHEVLRELPWKPWRKTRTPVNRGQLKKEVADCWHFMLELTMLWNMEDEIVDMMKASFKKNEERASNGY